ncbi:MAG: sensor histidine kinase, partial [Bacteroidia bacterium]
DFIKYIVEGAKRMQNLIDDLLTYSRVTTEAEVFKTIDMEEVLSESISNLKVLIDENQVKITHDPLPSIRADRSQIIQLFQNLIGNAIKFHSEKKPEVYIDAAENATEWLFSVRDNGIGIDEEYKEKVFVLFQRLHERSQYPGTGIGLSICRKIVELHSGNIWIESEPGKGSVFYFTLPK